MEEEIKKALVMLMEAVRKADGDSMATHIGTLDGLLDRGRGTLHPQLVHFLERHSYPKALMFLGGATDIPAGSCGGRP